MWWCGRRKLLRLPDSMAGLELLSDQGYRVDGRRAGELRKIQARMGVFAQADGSAYIEQGNTKALAVVYGPHEASGLGASRAISGVGGRPRTPREYKPEPLHCDARWSLSFSSASDACALHSSLLFLKVPGALSLFSSPLYSDFTVWMAPPQPLHPRGMSCTLHLYASQPFCTCHRRHQFNFSFLILVCPLT